MIGVNKVILVGNLGADPEIRRTQDGRSIANLRVATTDAWRDKASGERRERTEWHRVAIFNENLCKVAEQYLHKGSKVYVEGQLQTRDNAKMRTPKQGITDDQAQARRMEQRVHAQAALSNAIALVNDAEFILDPVGLLPCCTNFNRPRDYPGHDLTYINAFPDLASEHRLAGGGPDEGSAAGVRARGGTATQPLYGRRKWLTMPEKGLMQAISAAQRRRSILLVFQAL